VSRIALHAVRKITARLQLLAAVTAGDGAACSTCRSRMAPALGEHFLSKVFLPLLFLVSFLLPGNPQGNTATEDTVIADIKRF
jgi:hypothetical protein